MRLRILLLLAPWLATCAFAADDMAALLDKIASAYGGGQRLETATTLRETGRVEAATAIGRSGPLLRVFARPLKLRVEIGAEAGRKEVRVLDGTNAWRDGQAVTGPAAQAMVLQAVRLDLPWQLLANRHKLVEQESREYHGKHLRVLELPVQAGLAVAAGIDPATGQILFSIGRISGGPMGGLSFETDYGDFRSVNGRLFAFKETNRAGDTKTADTILSAIKVLNTVPEDSFKP